MDVKTINVDLNRVEGDLEFELDVQGDTIVDARCKGVMYRGFEQLLIGRAPTDSVVITPRVCGICGTAHMYCAVTALERMWNIEVPQVATLVRDFCLMAESVQSDMRQSFLMFTADFCNDAYAKHEMYPLLLEKFEPFKGQVYRETLDMSRKMVEIVALYGGQWPHSSYMLPGGVLSEPNLERAQASNEIIEKAIRWYETTVLDDTLENWIALDTKEALFDWVDKKDVNKSAMALFCRFSRDELKLQDTGKGTPNLLSYGTYKVADTWTPPFDNEQHWWRSGFWNGATQQVEDFDHMHISEHVKYSWFHPYKGGKHPYEGETKPHYRENSDQYTWAKAPRYEGKVAQTGPLSEMVIAGEPLIKDLFLSEQDNCWLRQFARMRRLGLVLQNMRETVSQLTQRVGQVHFNNVPDSQKEDGEGFGLVEAARGALGHWIKVENGVIDKYQIITPTAWNASPKDENDQPGHWEKSVIGMKLDDPDNPIQLSHVIRSHDPCLVCTVHALHEKGGQSINKNYRFGMG